MSGQHSYESELLATAERLVRDFARDHPADATEARFQILEAVASRLGGFALDEFNTEFKVRPIAPTAEMLERAKPVVEALEYCGIAPALALSGLARDQIDESSQRSSGAYHTDFRLASRLAELVTPKPTLKSKVIDPACGAGILLVALSIKVCGPDRRKMARWLSDCVHASDLSANALRGALLALASLTSDVKALSKMRAKWRVGDSLLFPTTVWHAEAPKGFDVVIANPPWEKVKLSRHEFLKANGHERHYGAETVNLNADAFQREQAHVARYADELTKRYPLLAEGEPDLYVAFTELFERLCKRGGTIAALVPGGLIRSQGTEALRRHLLDISTRLSVSIIENRARFFAIDTRFKFLAIVCIKRSGVGCKNQPILLRHERGTPDGLEKFSDVKIGRSALALVRPDLSIPEVKTALEWRIFCHMAERGVFCEGNKSPWRPVFCREVDMTKERPKFLTKPKAKTLPLVEGRMVQQHRFGAKEYLSGSGRRALWRVVPFGEARVAPQFYICGGDIPSSAQDRVGRVRGGFCDITGQTNERSVMAALIPPGVVCGNKVPTVLFPNDPDEERLLVWCAILNSVPFDWFARRIITTTINYFLLVSIPLPRLVEDGLPWRRLVAAARELRELDLSSPGPHKLLRAAELRALIDVEVAVAFGLKLPELAAMLNDFPLLDRGQPALPDEQQSTITKDTILLTAAARMKKDRQIWLSRVKMARDLGAIAYVPAEARDASIEELGIADAQ